MKSLFTQTKVPAEPGDLMAEFIANAERMAGDCLTEAGIDPHTLFKPVTEEPNGDLPGDSYLPWARIQRDQFSAEVGHALDILWHARAFRRTNDPYEAMLLAQQALKFDMDRLLLRPVSVGLKVLNANPNRKPDRTDEIEKYRRDNEVSLTAARIAIADKYGENPRTYMRQAKRKNR